jgi:hypothetical protein
VKSGLFFLIIFLLREYSMKNLTQRALAFMVSAVVFSGAVNALAGKDENVAPILQKIPLQSRGNVGAGVGTVKLPTQAEVERVAREAAQGSKKSNNLLGEMPAPVSVGRSAYDLGTNGSIYRRIAEFYDGTTHYAQIAWTAALPGEITTQFDTPPFPGRGSFFSIMDLSDMNKPSRIVPDAGDWKRIEPVRTGFTTINSVKDNGAIGVAAHPASGDMRYTTNTEFGLQTFTSNECGSSTSGGIWARSAVDGKGNIHMIYTYNSDNTAKANQLAYIRSTDGGVTWTTEQILTTTGAHTSGADSYAIAARGNTVVIAYSNTLNFQGIRVFKSTNNGTSFAGIDGGDGVLFSRPPVSFSNSRILANNGGTVNFTTDTVTAAGGSMSLLLDPTEKAHLVFSTYKSAIVGVRTLTKTSDGRDSLASVGRDTLAGVSYDEHKDYPTLGLNYWVEGATSATPMAPPCGGTWDGKGTVVGARITQEGLSLKPILTLDEKTGNLFCFYTSYINGDVKPVPFDTSASSTSAGDGTVDTTFSGLLCHTYVTVLAGGSWTSPQLLSKAGVDNRDATVYEKVVYTTGTNGYIYMAWQRDNGPGSWVTSPGIQQDDKEAEVLFTAIPLSVIANVGDENGVIRDNGISLATFPNPATGSTATIQFASENTGNATVELFNVLGAKVATLYSGAVDNNVQNVPFSTSGLEGGAYFVVVRQGSKSVTKSINIMK